MVGRVVVVAATAMARVVVWEVVQVEDTARDRSRVVLWALLTVGVVSAASGEHPVIAAAQQRVAEVVLAVGATWAVQASPLDLWAQ